MAEATVILVMILIALAKKGYGYPFGTMSLTTGKIVLAVAVLLLISAGVFVYLGFKKNQKFFEFSALSAGLATLAMLIKINFESKDLLHISGPSVMIGYHNNPKENAEVFSTDEEGKRWLNLKDYLVKEEDEFYKYVGRDKRNFVSRVDNIYPEEIEGLLQKLPEVRESVITPIPDDILQNIPHYYISLYSDKIDFNSLEKRIKKLISKYLGENALPGVIEYTTEPLKRMMNSKIDVEYYRKRTLESKGRVRTRK